MSTASHIRLLGSPSAREVDGSLDILVPFAVSPSRKQDESMYEAARKEAYDALMSVLTSDTPKLDDENPQRDRAVKVEQHCAKALTTWLDNRVNGNTSLTARSFPKESGVTLSQNYHPRSTSATVSLLSDEPLSLAVTVHGDDQPAIKIAAESVDAAQLEIDAINGIVYLQAPNEDRSDTEIQLNPDLSFLDKNSRRYTLTQTQKLDLAAHLTDILHQQSVEDRRRIRYLHEISSDAQKCLDTATETWLMSVYLGNLGLNDPITELTMHNHLDLFVERSRGSIRQDKDGLPVNKPLDKALGVFASKIKSQIGSLEALSFADRSEVQAEVFSQLEEYVYTAYAEPTQDTGEPPELTLSASSVDEPDDTGGHVTVIMAIGSKEGAQEHVETVITYGTVDYDASLGRSQTPEVSRDSDGSST